MTLSEQTTSADVEAMLRAATDVNNNVDQGLDVEKAILFMTDYLTFELTEMEADRRSGPEVKR